MPSAGGAPYSYSRMVEVINASSAESGVSVEVKKQCADGTYMPADDADLKTADFDMKLSQCINAVRDLPRARKLAFSKEMRDAGEKKSAVPSHIADARARTKTMQRDFNHAWSFEILFFTV